MTYVQVFAELTAAVRRWALSDAQVSVSEEPYDMQEIRVVADVDHSVLSILCNPKRQSSAPECAPDAATWSSTPAPTHRSSS